MKLSQYKGHTYDIPLIKNYFGYKIDYFKKYGLATDFFGGMMDKEAKYTIYFVGFICILIFVAGLLSGCKSKGYQGWIYHNKDLIVKTSCETELFLTISPDLIEVRSVYDSYGLYFDREVYKYKNDGKYRVEKKECER